MRDPYYDEETEDFFPNTSSAFWIAPSRKIKRWAPSTSSMFKYDAIIVFTRGIFRAERVHVSSFFGRTKTILRPISTGSLLRSACVSFVLPVSVPDSRPTITPFFACHDKHDRIAQ